MHFFYSLIIVCLIRICVMKTVNNFGPFDFAIIEYEFCKGPKQKNLTNIALDVSVDRKSGVFNINYLANTRIDEIKIVVSSLSGNTTKVLWTYKLNDPCKHFAAATLIDYYYKSPSCLVKKGKYKSHVKFDEVTKLFMGNKFFYGTYLIRVNILSNQGNIMCLKLINLFDEKKD